MNAREFNIPKQEPVRWEQPEIFDLSLTVNQQRFDEAINDGRITRFVDPVVEIAKDLFEYQNPEAAEDPKQRAEFVDSVVSQGHEFGNWVLFPWSGHAVRFPDKEIHQQLRTARNYPLISREEQQRLLNARVAVIGLSVGSNALEQLMRGGIGGTAIISDRDIYMPMNQNRLSAPYEQIGALKTDIAGIKLSELDPYVEQIHLPQGISEGNLHELEATRPDIIIEEVDSMAIMALLRRFARDNKLPLITGTDIDQRSVIDVERYDLGLKKMFNGRIKENDAQALIKSLSGREEDVLPEGVEDNLMLKHVGLSNLSVRFMKAAMLRGREISGHPQLGTTAAGTATAVAEKARDILLGNPTPSGRYTVKPQRRFHLPTATQVSEGAVTVKQLLKYAKELKNTD